MSLASYDRLFPSQDVLPAGGVGNLIAAPLHGRSRRDGATVFLDLATVEPHEDQWAFLSTLGRMSPREVARAADKAGRVRVGAEVSQIGAPVSTRTRPAPHTITHPASHNPGPDEDGTPQLDLPPDDTITRPAPVLRVHPTRFCYTGGADPSAPGGIAAIYRDLAADATRTAHVCEALARGRHSLAPPPDHTQVDVPEPARPPQNQPGKSAT